MKIFSVYGVVVLGAFIASTAWAGEIQYGHIEAVQDDTIYIQYQGPAGEQHFVCELDSTDCSEEGEAPQLLPAILGKTTYTTSPDGLYGVVGRRLGAGATAVYIHQLYDVSGAEAVSVATLPYLRAVTDYKFTWSNKQVVLFGSNGDVVTYDITKKSARTISPQNNAFSLRSLSPRGKYLSYYNYTKEAHEILNTTTGALTSISSQLPVYVEFSADETLAAFADDRNGYKTLYVATVASAETSQRHVFADDFVVEDYIWFGNKLYAIGNTEANPYRWVLYEYDPKGDVVRIVAEDVSYGDYLRPLSGYGLSFLIIEGKNSHVAVYKPEQDEVVVFDPVPPSPASTEIDRDVVQFDDMYGVLYAPKKPDKRPDLFVWLHGGPKRQTSFGYHSYRSYAVYDELLERIAESGAYVVKLDYPGSYGYSRDFMEQLEGQLGVVDVAAVRNTSRELQREYNIADTYLIGNSYGGYLGPKVLVDHQDEFAGAIAINGVFDWFNLIKRIPSSPFATYFNGAADYTDPLQNFALYTKASITNNLTKLSEDKKLLLVYGALDATVPTWQTTEFYEVANVLGKDVELLRFDDEDHILRQRDTLDAVCVFIADKLHISDMSCTL